TQSCRKLTSLAFTLNHYSLYRLMEHSRAAVAGNIQNPWGAHDSSKHSNTPTPDVPFRATIIRTQDHVDRKLMEAIEIAENRPRLNTDSGWQLLPTVRKRVACGQVT
ncbi:MAG: hypothetical protein MJE68_32220, partial [Proteobacteria bacterium]|nr:hypothetical protein [Pseudomonadota bacterium]